MKYLEGVTNPQAPQDEVDAIIRAWSALLPDADVAPMAVFSRVSRLARQLDLRRRQAFLAHGLEPWEFDVLASLRRGGEGYCATPGALMTELLVSSGTMTNRIDRLEHKGLVRRQPSPHDRRGVQVLLTEAGQARVDRALIELVAVENELLAPLATPERERLAALLRALSLPLDTR